MKKKARKFRVWIAQVNQTYVDVTADTPEEAADKAERKWRREEASFRIRDIKESHEP